MLPNITSPVAPAGSRPYRRLATGAIFVLFVAFVLFSSCSRQPSPLISSSVITAEQAHAAMDALGIMTVSQMTADDSYALLSFDWLTNDFRKDFEQFKFSRSMKRWREARNDCDDFALAADFFVHDSFRDAPGPKAAIGFGEFWYTRSATHHSHAINFALVPAAATNVTVIFVEPETSQIVNLTPDEIQSCFGWRM